MWRDTDRRAHCPTYRTTNSETQLTHNIPNIQGEILQGGGGGFARGDSLCSHRISYKKDKLIQGNESFNRFQGESDWGEHDEAKMADV